MTVSELIEIAEKCASEDWCCAFCKLKDDLYCRDKIISALLDEIKKEKTTE